MKCVNARKAIFHQTAVNVIQQTSMGQIANVSESVFSCPFGFTIIVVANTELGPGIAIRANDPWDRQLYSYP